MPAQLVEKSVFAPFASFPFRDWAIHSDTFMIIVSMVNGQLFDTLAALAKELRKSDKPFGGIQVSLVCFDIVTCDYDLLTFRIL